MLADLEISKVSDNIVVSRFQQLLKQNIIKEEDQLFVEKHCSMLNNIFELNFIRFCSIKFPKLLCDNSYLTMNFESLQLLLQRGSVQLLCDIYSRIDYKNQDQFVQLLLDATDIPLYNKNLVDFLGLQKKLKPFIDTLVKRKLFQHLSFEILQYNFSIDQQVQFLDELSQLEIYDYLDTVILMIDAFLLLDRPCNFVLILMLLFNKSHELYHFKVLKLQNCNKADQFLESQVAMQDVTKIVRYLKLYKLVQQLSQKYPSNAILRLSVDSVFNAELSNQLDLDVEQLNSQYLEKNGDSQFQRAVQCENNNIQIILELPAVTQLQFLKSYLPQKELHIKLLPECLKEVYDLVKYPKEMQCSGGFKMLGLLRFGEVASNSASHEKLMYFQLIFEQLCQMDLLNFAGILTEEEVFQLQKHSLSICFTSSRILVMRRFFELLKEKSIMDRVLNLVLAAITQQIKKFNQLEQDLLVKITFNSYLQNNQKFMLGAVILAESNEIVTDFMQSEFTKLFGLQDFESGEYWLFAREFVRRFFQTKQGVSKVLQELGQQESEQPTTVFGQMNAEIRENLQLSYQQQSFDFRALERGFQRLETVSQKARECGESGALAALQEAAPAVLAVFK